jgi:predicted  nucleic acid-binding Zn-ribbon protein
MTNRSECGDDRQRGGWEHLGRAAEQFARRVSRDARRFASRLEEDVEELARDVRRDWRCGQRAWQRSDWSPEDVRRVFNEVRTVLRSVIDSVDEMIGGAFHDAAAGDWTKVVSNRDEICKTCSRTIPAGSEAFVRGSAVDREFRCAECSPPSGAASS